MNAAGHVIPLDGILVDRARGPGRMNGTGIATAALTTVDALDEPADLVLVAVPAGRGQALLESIVEA